MHLTFLIEDACDEFKQVSSLLLSSLHKVHYPEVSSIWKAWWMRDAPIFHQEVDLLATSRDQCVSFACLSMKREKMNSFISLFAALKCVDEVRHTHALDFYEL